MSLPFEILPGNLPGILTQKPSCLEPVFPCPCRTLHSFQQNFQLSNGPLQARSLKLKPHDFGVHAPWLSSHLGLELGA